jgi:BirA family biotin operon repressor/biotin-[acetyl-CoA-carboxylase] ligase
MAKSAILNLLREGPSVVSGEKMSSALGISRVAVWKHIRALRDLGYPIEPTPKGYLLEGSTDYLFSWEFSGQESLVHFSRKTGSTMEVARHLAAEGHPHGTLVLADRQEQGRGRAQRKWVSEPGGLYMTRVLKPDLPPQMINRVLFAASLALAHSLRRLYSLDSHLKWPNDLLVGERKVAGFLADAEVRGNSVRYVNLGVGVNVNNNPRKSETGSDSLARIVGKRLSRKELLCAFLDELDDSLLRLDTTELLRAWKAHSSTIGRIVRVVSPGEAIVGKAEDIDETGRLIVTDNEGEKHKIYSGDCLYERGFRGEPKLFE